MICQMTCPLILNYLLTMRLFFQLYVIKNPTTKDYNDDLQNISNWTCQWKMSFNPDPLNQAQEEIFLQKHTKISQPMLQRRPRNSFKKSSFLPSSCSEKTRWRRGCQYCFLTTIQLKSLHYKHILELFYTAY